jgi:HEAT repeat protein
VTVAKLATAALFVLTAAAIALGAMIVFGRTLRRAREAARARLAAPARRTLLALAAGDDGSESLNTLVRLEPRVWLAVEPMAVALLGKVRGEAHAALVSAFEQRGMAGRALREVGARGAVRRARAAEVLGNLGHGEAVPSLVRLLADPDPDVRAVAARALGRIADPVAAGPLLDSLAGRRRVPPQAVAHAVMRMGAGAQTALAAALDHEADLVRATAVEVLGLVGAITAAGRVIDALRRDPSLQVRQRAAATLGRLGTRSGLPPLLEAVEPERDPTLRAVAARALGDLGAVAAAPALGALLSDHEHEVAHAAAYSLLRLGQAGRNVLDEAAAVGTDRRATRGSAPIEPEAARAAAYAGEALAVSAVEDQRRTGESTARTTVPATQAATEAATHVATEVAIQTATPAAVSGR